MRTHEWCRHQKIERMAQIRKENELNSNWRSITDVDGFKCDLENWEDIKRIASIKQKGHFEKINGKQYEEVISESDESKVFVGRNSEQASET